MVKLTMTDVFLRLMLVVLVVMLVAMIGLLIYLIWRIVEDKFFCVDKKYRDVSVKIIDAYHVDSHMVPRMVGKTVVMKRRPEENIVKVLYNGRQYLVDDERAYVKYKNKVGSVVTGVLEACCYKNGKTRVDVVGLQ